MSAVYFDTYRIVTILNKKGFIKEQSEAVVEALQEINLEHLATKKDLSDLRFELLKWIIPLFLGLYGLIILKLGV